MAEVDELVAAFGAMLEASDGELLRRHLAPGAVVWHNHDRAEVDAIANMAGIEMLGQLVNDLKVETRYCSPTDDGFVLQFVTHGSVASNGRPFEMHNCIVVTTSDGKIERIEEYVDPTVGAQLSGT